MQTNGIHNSSLNAAALEPTSVSVCVIARICIFWNDFSGIGVTSSAACGISFGAWYLIHVSWCWLLQHRDSNNSARLIVKYTGLSTWHVCYSGTSTTPTTFGYFSHAPHSRLLAPSMWETRHARSAATGKRTSSTALTPTILLIQNLDAGTGPFPTASPRSSFGPLWSIQT